MRIMKCLNCGFIDNLIKDADDIYGDPQCAKCKSGAYEVVEPSKPSDVLYPPSEGISMGTIRVMTEAEIRADERAKCKEIVKMFLIKANGCWDTDDLLNLLK